MKYNKIALVVSSLVTILCLIAYGCFGYIPCMKNCFIKDIALAVLGSAVLLLATSVIGYFVERAHLRRQIINATLNMNTLDEAYRANGTNVSTKNNIIKVIRVIKDRTRICYHYLKQYKEGSFKKDKDLLKILNETIPHYVRWLGELENLIRTAKANEDDERLAERPGEEERKIIEEIFSWAGKSGFNFDDNFESDIIEDEKEQEKND